MATRPLDELKDLEICGCLGFVEALLDTAARVPAAGPKTEEQPATADERPPDPEADLGSRPSVPPPPPGNGRRGCIDTGGR
jgi:hypothetical protein